MKPETKNLLDALEASCDADFTAFELARTMKDLDRNDAQYFGAYLFVSHYLESQDYFGDKHEAIDVLNRIWRKWKDAYNEHKERIEAKNADVNYIEEKKVFNAIATVAKRHNAWLMREARLCKTKATADELRHRYCEMGNVLVDVLCKLGYGNMQNDEIADKYKYLVPDIQPEFGKTLYASLTKQAEQYKKAKRPEPSKDFFGGELR